MFAPCPASRPPARRRRAALLPPALLLAASAFWPDPAAAQATLDSLGDAFPRNAPPMPVCNAPRDGVSACLAGRQCSCGYERGGSITGRRDGWRWDCGVMRPACDVAPAGAPSVSPPYGGLPYGAVPYADPPLGLAPFGGSSRTDNLPFGAPHQPRR